MPRAACKALDADERIVDFWVRASHYESLHPHNAVAVASSKACPAATAAAWIPAPLR